MENVKINKVNITPVVELIEVTHENIAIVRGTDKCLYIKDENDYFLLIGTITYTKKDLILIIDKYIDSKGINKNNLK